MEPVILMSLRHNNLIEGVEAKVDSMSGYYVQELGKRNLLQERRNDVFTPQQKRRYCHQLAQAVKVLHSLNIVHGDIKSTNVVMHHDGVKLLDFSLSFITRDDEKYYTEMCTANYRPPEVILKMAWKKSIDIWCLACVFYEIYYGRQLFKGQQGDVDRNESLSRIQMTNVIADWNDILVGKYGREPYLLVRQNVDYIPFVLHETFDDRENECFNDLLINMLEMREDERYDINMVLGHRFFEDEETTDARCLRSPCKQLEDVEEKRCRRHLEICCNEKFRTLVYELYTRCRIMNYTVDQEETVVRACTHIIYKLYRIGTPQQNDNVYRMEREIANALHFHLLPSRSSMDARTP